MYPQGLVHQKAVKEKFSVKLLNLRNFYKFVGRRQIHKDFYLGAFTYDVRFLDRQVGQAESDFTRQAYVVKSDQGRQAGQKCPKNI